ncbi:transcriptional regulator [bacterium]|nr:transcriptional regulator [bacterium]
MQAEQLAEVLKLHRKAAGLSRIQLAELAGVGKTVIYDLENGKETVQLDTLRKIFKVLNITMVLTSPLMYNLAKTGNEKG